MAILKEEHKFMESKILVYEDHHIQLEDGLIIGLDCLLLGSWDEALESDESVEADTFLEAVEETAENFSIAFTKVLEAAEAGLPMAAMVGIKGKNFKLVDILTVEIPLPKWSGQSLTFF